MPRAYIHCIRHAQGQHNVAECYDFRDAELTPLGHQQCAELASKEHDLLSKVSFVASSPMTRALNTAKNVFQDRLAQKTLPSILAVPEAQEISDLPCDIGSDPDVLRERVASRDWPVDLSLVEDGWNDKSLNSRFSGASSAISTRARATRKLLHTRARALLKQNGYTEDVHLALVAHGSFMHFLTNDWEDSTNYAGTAWKNCELRSYTFEDARLDIDNDACWFAETPASRVRRGKSYAMYTRALQETLFSQTMTGWEDQGLPNHHTLDQSIKARI